MLMTLGATLSGGGAEVLESYLVRMANGDMSALSGLYERTHAAIYGYALSLLKNVQDAEDVMQDTLVKAFHSAGQYRSAGKPMAYLMTIARNEALMRIRSRGRTVAMSPEDWQEQFADRPDMSQEDMLTLKALLDTLSDEEREIVTLHALTGLKHREIASLLGLALPTVLSKYNRAIKKLGKSLKEAE